MDTKWQLVSAQNNIDDKASAEDGARVDMIERAVNEKHPVCAVLLLFYDERHFSPRPAKNT